MQGMSAPENQARSGGHVRDGNGRFLPGVSGNRKRGPSKLTREVREMLLQALEEEGGVKYLRWAARTQPAAFLSLLGRLLPTEIRASLDDRSGEPVKITVITGIEGEPGSRWPDNYKAEQQRKAELEPGESRSGASNASIELGKSSVVEHVEPDPNPQPVTWVPLRPDKDERPKVAQLD